MELNWKQAQPHAYWPLPHYFSFCNDTSAEMQAETELTMETPYENLGMLHSKLFACLYFVKLSIVH